MVPPVTVGRHAISQMTIYMTNTFGLTQFPGITFKQNGNVRHCHRTTELTFSIPHELPTIERI